MDDLQLVMAANRFKNLERAIYSMAYERGHSAGEDEVNSIAMGIRHEIYPALLKDIRGFLIER